MIMQEICGLLFTTSLGPHPELRQGQHTGQGTPDVCNPQYMTVQSMGDAYKMWDKAEAWV